jgi:hypothetical protein
MHPIRDALDVGEPLVRGDCFGRDVNGVDCRTRKREDNRSHRISTANIQNQLAVERAEEPK